jgi:arylsulfotransferase ASST
MLALTLAACLAAQFGQPFLAPAQAAISCLPAKLNRSALVVGVVEVSPLPYSLDASPATQISFLGVPASGLRAISVTGSRTSGHSGRLRPYSQGNGASFVPSHGFAAGETVSVRGQVRTGSSWQRFGYRFTIAHQYRLPMSKPGAEHTPRPGEVQTFKTQPTVQAPTITVTTPAAPAAAPGYIFAAPYSGLGNDGPMVVDSSGQLVWFHPMPFGTEAADLKVQSYGGQPVLTWWQGAIHPQGFGEGEVEIVDQSYRSVAKVRAGNGYAADLHDFVLTPDGTALLTVFDPLHCDTSGIGGTRDGYLTDTLFQQVDVRTGLVEREWHALDAVPLSDSMGVAAGSSVRFPFDWFHLNSVHMNADGSFIISARNTSALYELDGHTRQVVAEIGGKQSSFTMGAGTSTAYQHDAQLQPDGTISVFDNGGVPRRETQSRAIRLRVDPGARTVTLVSQLTHTAPVLAGSQGNVEVLANGDTFVGWGAASYFTEYGPDGQVLFDARLTGNNQSYRTYRFPWTGTPDSAPVVAVQAAAHGGLSVYASWNGASRVASCRVLAGRSTTALSPAVSALRSDFETAIPLSSTPPYVAVQALDAAGNVLGTSPPIAG